MSDLGFVPCYFLAPTRNYQPDGRIKLGNIISSPSYPDEPTNTSPISIDDKDLEIHKEKGWALSRGKKSDVKVGLFASFLQLIVGVGADASVGQVNDRNAMLHTGVVITKEFNPSRELVAKSLDDPGVKEFVKVDKNIFKSKIKKLYMINGIKIATEASMTAEAARERNVHLHAAADGTPAGVPIAGGVNVDVTHQNTAGESFEHADDFVLGFRLREIKLTAKGNVTHKQFKDGATFGIPTGEAADDFEFDFEVKEEDARGTDVSREEHPAVDEFGSEFCVFVDPTS